MAEYGIKDVRSLAKANAHQWSDLRREMVGIRREKGLTQADICERLGWAKAWVRTFENYDSNQAEDNYMSYASAVGIQFRLVAVPAEVCDD